MIGRCREERDLTRVGILTLCLLFGMGTSVAQAVPALQLDIADGYYDSASQTIMTASNTFTLYALLDPAQLNVTRGYYLSIALLPMTSDAANLGYFSVNGTEVNATSGMTYGVPPLEGLTASFDPGDLDPHDIYPTYFYEIAFRPNLLNTSSVYDTALAPGGISTNLGGSGLLYAAFQMDTTFLSSPYQLHFDLYSERLLLGEDLDIKNFAPFTHDAGTSSSVRGVPEPSAVLLMGIGLLGLGVWQWRNTQRAA